MSYKLNTRSLSNEICAINAMSCLLECEYTEIDTSSAGFAEYIASKRSEISLVGDVAVIPVSGALGERLDDFDVYFGMTDYSDVREKIIAANDDPTITAIVLDIDSPGGFVVGTEETAQVISDSAKPVVAFTNTMAASAAYWLGVAADAFYATPSSQVGSVGVYSLFYDWSKAFERAGITAELFTSGSLKGMGAVGVPLTDEQREYLQNNVEELAIQFKSYVVSRRGKIDDRHMEGQTVRGRAALAAGMIDRLGDFASAVQEASDAAAIR